MFGPKSSKGAVLRGRELVEAFCGLGGVLALGWWVPVPWRPSHLIFCAFFLLVFAVAVRYQTGVAYSTAVCAAVAYGLLLWFRPEQRPASLALEPFVLLLAGICASDILRWQRLRLSTLEQMYAHTRQALQEAQEQCQQGVKAREVLERQIRERPASLVTVSEKLTQFGLLEGAQRLTALLDVLVSVLDARSCACYMQEGDTLRLCAERLIEGSTHAPLLDTEDPLVKRVIDWRQVSTVCDALAEMGELTPDVAVMAGPVLGPAGELTGVVIIDHMPLLRLTSGAMRLFSSLLQLFSLSLRSPWAHMPGADSIVSEALQGAGRPLTKEQSLLSS